MKCLVSGATGFIGRQLCQQLAARGDTVIPLSRSGASLPTGIPTRAVDLADTDPDAQLLRGVDVVFHLAGIAHQHAPAEAYSKVNFQASLKLAHLAAEAGAGCFVFLSSVKAMGPSSTTRPRSEGDCNPPEDPYGSSKWQAECALREQFADSNMAVVILRPALVYGESPKGNLLSLARGVRRGLPRPPAGGGRSMVALADLVDLLCLLADNSPPGVNTWIVSDGASHSTREIYDLLRAAMGKGRGTGWLPHWGWRLGAWLLDQTGGVAGDRAWDKLFGAECYSNDAVVAATGWRPVRRLEDLVADMVIGREKPA